MSQTTGGAFGGFVANDPALAPWIDAIGKLIVNFTSIELVTYVWIDKLGDPTLHHSSLGRPFARRVDTICELIRRSSAPDSVKANAESMWAKAKAISEFRNNVVHNPVACTWRTRPASGPPDFIAIPLMRELRNDPTAVPTIGLDRIRREIDRIADLGPPLQSALDDLLRHSTGRDCQPSDGTT
jgi:hypothetical protein